MNFEGTKMLKGQHFGRAKIIIKTTSSVDTHLYAYMLNNRFRSSQKNTHTLNNTYKD